MSLIKCIECGKEISDKASACPNCGYPLVELEKFIETSEKQMPITIDITDNLSDSNNIECASGFCKLKNFFNSKSFLLVAFGGVLVFLLILFGINSEYSYKRNGIYGFEQTIKWDMDKEKLDSIDFGVPNSSSMDHYSSYEGIEFVNEINGDLTIAYLDKDNPDEISSIGFSIKSEETWNDVSDIISEELGDPIYKDNLNNERIGLHKWIWSYDKNQLIILKNYSSGLRLEWEKCDDTTIEKSKLVQAKIDEDEKFKKTYDLLFDRIKYEGGSIEDVINKLGITEYEISEGSGLFGYEYDSVNYIEHVELFGYKSKIMYHCRNPYDDDFPDFIGKVEYIMFKIEEELTAEQIEELSKHILKYTGKENSDDKREYLPIKINYSKESKYWIDCDINDRYYLINPEYGSDDSTEEIKNYTDCEESILHLELDNTKHKVDENSDSAEKCWNLTKDYVLKNLKVPSSATFPNNKTDCVITREGNVYKVTSYVEAENSFGAKIKTYFVVTLHRNGESFTVKDVYFK